IPLGGAGGIMADGDKETERIDELFLQGMFPELGGGSVAAAVVGQDEQAGGGRIAITPGAQPPVADGFDREGGRIARRAERDATPVGLEIVNAIGDGDAVAERGEVVVVDLDRLPAPDLSGVLEAAHHFALLRVDADDRRTFRGKTLPLAAQVAELPIALRTGLAEALAVGVQRI